MRVSRLILALIVGLVGLVWIGQGIGVIGGSAMTGSNFWGLMGAVLVAAAILIVALERRRSAKG